MSYITFVSAGGAEEEADASSQEDDREADDGEDDNNEHEDNSSRDDSWICCVHGSTQVSLCTGRTMLYDAKPITSQPVPQLLHMHNQSSSYMFTASAMLLLFMDHGII